MKRSSGSIESRVQYVAGKTFVLELLKMTFSHVDDMAGTASIRGLGENDAGHPHEDGGPENRRGLCCNGNLDTVPQSETVIN